VIAFSSQLFYSDYFKSNIIQTGKTLPFNILKGFDMKIEIV